MPAADARVRLDLNSPDFQDTLFRLQADDLKQVIAALRRLRQLDWKDLYRHPGFHWEAFQSSALPNVKVHPLRLSQRIRAVAFRDGAFLCLLSLHPGHDSAYR